MPGDVFEEDPFRLDFADDAGNVWPEVAFVVCPLPLSRGAERLTRVSCDDGVDRSPERTPVEGGDIIPDRGGSEVSGALACDDGLSGVVLPFDKAAGVESGFCEHEAKIKASASCAEG
jgi:hypothetical protein